MSSARRSTISDPRPDTYEVITIEPTTTFKTGRGRASRIRHVLPSSHFVTIVGDLLTFAAPSSHYGIPVKGESVREAWRMTGNALSRAMYVERGKK